MFTRCFFFACVGLLAACDPSPVTPAPGGVEPPPASINAITAAGMPRKVAPEGAAVYIIAPRDGEAVSSPVRILFGMRGAGVAPAGVEKAGTGHHHLLLDTPEPTLNLPIPADDRHIHFGGGQTETTLALPPGTHTLQLLLGDELHVPHDPPLLSEIVTIEVR